MTISLLSLGPVLGYMVVLVVLVGCASPVVKREVFDPGVLAQQPLPAAQLRDGESEETVVVPSTAWMATDTRRNLTFVQYRPEDGEPFFCLVLGCEPATDSLVLQPLDPDESPLAALARPKRAAELRAATTSWAVDPANAAAEALLLSLHEVVDGKQLGPPVPTPGRIFGVASNFPSHLEHDLAIDPELFERVATSRPRVFQKHPPVPAPGMATHEANFRGVIGPFDDIRYPERLYLPENEAGEFSKVRTNLDYEVELGVVIGRSLDWATVANATDAELFEAVAGYLLISDVKARNPQLFERALARGSSPDGTVPYATGDSGVDGLLGDWTESSSQWWSYAASQGDYASLGPFFVASPPAGAMPQPALLCARTYADTKRRGASIPRGRETGTFYLRQCSRASTESGYHDAMLWGIPAILRGMLDPDRSVLSRDGQPLWLEPGDVISLGTPGGVVLTVRGRSLYAFLDYVLFWWDALDWHDAFFEKDAEKYLREGDEVFLWAEGLGCQRNFVRVVKEEGAK